MRDSSTTALFILSCLPHMHAARPILKNCSSVGRGPLCCVRTATLNRKLGALLREQQYSMRLIARLRAEAADAGSPEQRRRGGAKGRQVATEPRVGRVSAAETEVPAQATPPAVGAPCSLMAGTPSTPAPPVEALLASSGGGSSVEIRARGQVSEPQQREEGKGTVEKLGSGINDSPLPPTRLVLSSPYIGARGAEEALQTWAAVTDTPLRPAAQETDDAAQLGRANGDNRHAQISTEEDIAEVSSATAGLDQAVVLSESEEDRGAHVSEGQLISGLRQELQEARSEAESQRRKYLEEARCGPYLAGWLAGYGVLYLKGLTESD
jgi:hypothetical protein